MKPADILALQVDHLPDMLEAWLGARPIETIAAPAAEEARPHILAALRQEGRKLGTFVSAEARQALETLLAKPNLLPPGLINEITQQEAMEQLMSDVLYLALHEFSGLVPGLLKKALPFGLGGVLDGIKAELDKR